MGSLIDNSINGTFVRPRFQLHGPRNSEHDIRSLPDLIDFDAERNPDHLFLVQEERREGCRTGFAKVTFSELRELVSSCAGYIASRNIQGLEPEEVESKGTPKTIALYMESDLTLFVFLCALLWMRIPVVLLSARLNARSIAHLLSQTHTSGIVCSSRTEKQVAEALDLLPEDKLKPLVIGAVSYREIARYASKHTHERRRSSKQDLNDVPGALILHSSGTTGLPKPIPLAHRYLLGYSACHRLSPHEAEGRLNVSTLPLYHGFGLLAPCLSLSIGKPCCLLASSVVPSSESTIDLLKAMSAKSLMTIPTILEQVVSNSSAAAYNELGCLDFVAIGGGPLKHAVGDVLKCRGINLLNHYGATELGALAYIHVPDKTYDWHYLRLRTDMALSLTETGNVSGDSPIYQLSAHPFGWDANFTVQDSLLKKTTGVPDDEVEVQVLSRTDDVVVLATGEKVWPQLIETTVQALPAVETAVVFGEQQDEIGLLVELRAGSRAARDQDAIEAVWSTVQTLNQSLDGHARISSKEAILIKPEGKVIPRSDKGSVMRKEVYETFAEDLAGVYRHLQGSGDQKGGRLEKSALEQGLRSLVESCLDDRISSHRWGNNDDFFELGMDSLEATRLARSLGRISNVDDYPGIMPGMVHPNFVYRNPTLERLAAAIQRLPRSSADNRLLRMQILKEKHIKEATARQLNLQEKQPVVLLTGSTGSIGAHLLHGLAINERVKRIICLNRSQSQPRHAERQIAVNARHGLNLPAKSWDKIEFFTVDTSSTDMGLDFPMRKEIASQITHVLHNAWPMDFQRSLESYDSQVRVVRSLIELCRDAYMQQRLKPRFVFLSSIAAVGRYHERVVPEEPLDDPSGTMPMGYAEAKWICEQVLVNAAGDAVEQVVIRIGQLSGSSKTGYWNSNEHLPAILKASQAIGALPALKGSYAWLPVDVASQVILDIAFSRYTKTFFHVENPVRQSWPQLLDALVYELKPLFPATVSFETWLDLVAASESSEKLLSLMDFIKHDFSRLSSGALILDTRNARYASPVLRSCGGISMELLGKYIQSWRAERILQG